MRETRRRALDAAGIPSDTIRDLERGRPSTNLYVSNIHRSVNEQARRAPSPALSDSSCHLLLRMRISA